jgi:hypothetical protein
MILLLSALALHADHWGGGDVLGLLVLIVIVLAILRLLRLI